MFSTRLWVQFCSKSFHRLNNRRCSVQI